MPWNYCPWLKIFVLLSKLIWFSTVEDIEKNSNYFGTVPLAVAVAFCSSSFKELNVTTFLKNEKKNSTYRESRAYWMDQAWDGAVWVEAIVQRKKPNWNHADSIPLLVGYFDSGVDVRLRKTSTSTSCLSCSPTVETAAWRSPSLYYQTVTFGRLSPFLLSTEIRANSAASFALTAVCSFPQSSWRERNWTEFN